MESPRKQQAIPLKAFISLILLCLCSLATAAAERITIAGAEITAMYAPLLIKVLARADIEARFIALPQARFLPSLAKGLYDGGFMLSEFAIQDIPGMVAVQQPIGEGLQTAVTLEPGIHITHAADLAHYRVGIERGNKPHQSLRPYLNEYQEVVDATALFRLLAAGRIDVLITPEIFVPALSKEAGLDKVYIQRPPVVRHSIYLGLNQSAAHLEPRIRAVLKESVASGEWEREKTRLRASMRQRAAKQP